MIPGRYYWGPCGKLAFQGVASERQQSSHGRMVAGACLAGRWRLVSRCAGAVFTSMEEYQKFLDKEERAT